MSLGRVAENSSVRRSGFVASRMNSRSSLKPRSSISSASSSTTTSSADRSRWPRSRWSRNRPGVPTTKCAPRRRSALLAPRIHAADAGHHEPARRPVEPSQFPRHLQRQFPRRRDGQHQRRGRRAQLLRRRRGSSARWRGRRRQSCLNPSGPKPAGRGLPRRTPAPRSGPASAPCSPVPPGRARGMGLTSSKVIQARWIANGAGKRRCHAGRGSAQIEYRAPNVSAP